MIENGGVTHNFESGPPKDHFLVIFLSGIKITQKNR
ncbi:hypothetical protein BAZSYMA_ACONTIG166660_0 [Bathymodiolus azoricus thioautotrophic gill symbiont]|uniref:Uncharacterized protein n=1 Tax=Bathymodiolus azoricus thioautotrophic gill symbiont TaxID=235205 RepID=A0A1H6KAV1_9GAMM|nr:hypothetical protein BAZSYMA_ACONTIG166660_0 [Bathymodiolus azoricus thioautotrophic gill symbiont]